MTGIEGSPRAGRDPQVWLLGNTHPAADRSIGWHDQLPNLGDPDALIVDMTTLTKDVIRQIDSLKLDQAKRYIGDKFFSGGTVVVVTAAEFSATPLDIETVRPIAPWGSPFVDRHEHSNYRFLPAVLETVPTEKGSRVLPDAGHDFGAYLGAVAHFEFYIAGHVERFRTGPGGQQFALERVGGQDVRDNSGHDLGFALAAVEEGRGMRAGRAANTGTLVFLPPYTEPAADAIGKILFVYGKAPLHEEVPPAWVENLPIHKGAQLQAEIAKLGAQRSQIQAQIDELARERDEIMGHRRLLHSKGHELEEAVASAFRLLGLDTKQMGGADREDCLLAMDAGGYAHGVVEVKGAGNRTKQQDIVQCEKWVDAKYTLEGRLPKGIFVPNQHRMKEYPKSSKERLWFEPNELKYVRAKDICIIPSCVLFEAARQVLDGAAAPDAAKTAEKIAGTRGVLERVF